MAQTAPHARLGLSSDTFPKNPLVRSCKQAQTDRESRLNSNFGSEDRPHGLGVGDRQPASAHADAEPRLLRATATRSSCSDSHHTVASCPTWAHLPPLIDHVVRRDCAHAPRPGDRCHMHPGSVAVHDLGEVRQPVVHADDVAGLDAREPHRATHAGARSAHTNGHRHVRVLRIEDEFERAGLEAALVADVAQESAFG